ncbi:MAG: hypothetical protein RML36_14525 [Anaerolineae bacterium]|nr:hypothetical protein [Anaerolineae bacterium]MDW8100685.1 hypothetical protein [Anaerolineae bacterium]
MVEESVEVLLDRIQRYLDSRVGQPTSARPAALLAMKGRFSTEVYERLTEADAIKDAIAVELSLTPFSLPLLGGLWQKARMAAHRLVVFYVNRLAGSQAAFNREIVAGLIALVRDLERDEPAALEAEVARLRTEVQALQAEVAALRKRLSGDSS